MRLCADHRDSITVPDYDVVSRGLLRKILRDANISTEDFVEASK